MICELCESNLVDSEHHLIPKMCHKNKWFKKNYTREELVETIGVCKGCHRCLNKLFPNKQQKALGKEYYTKELLLEHPMIIRHVEWSRKHPNILPTR